jgi:hypothetical protein
MEMRVVDFLRIKPEVWNFTKNIYVNCNVMTIEMTVQVLEV